MRSISTRERYRPRSEFTVPAVVDRLSNIIVDDPRKPFGWKAGGIIYEAMPVVSAISFNSGDMFEGSATIAAAVEAIGAAPAILRLHSGFWEIGENLTIPGNIVVYFDAGAILNLAEGVTCSINAMIPPETHSRIFSNTGTFRLPTLRYVLPEWWGAAGDGNPANASINVNALNSALITGLPCYLRNGVYLINGDINVVNSALLFGAGPVSILRAIHSGAIIKFEGGEFTIRDIHFQGDDHTSYVNQHGISKTSGWHLLVDNCMFSGLNGAGIHNNAVSGVTVINNCTFSGGMAGLLISGGETICEKSRFTDCEYPLFVDQAETPVIIGNSDISGGVIRFYKNKNTRIVGSRVNVDAYQFEGCDSCSIEDLVFPSSGGLDNTILANYNLDPSHVTWRNTRNDNGVLSCPDSAKQSGWDSNFAGGCVRAELDQDEQLPVGTTVLLAGSGGFNVLWHKSIANDNSGQTLHNFYNEATGEFNVLGFGDGEVFVEIDLQIDPGSVSPDDLNISIATTWGVSVPLAHRLAGAMLKVNSRVNIRSQTDGKIWFEVANTGASAATLKDGTTFTVWGL